MLQCDNINGDGSCEIMLFGVRVQIDPMRKCVSMNNISQYEHPLMPESLNNTNNNNNLDVNMGYISVDEAVHNKLNRSRERKRGVPWTENEHKLFLQGLQKVGKGDWRGISRDFVKTRTATQVASHAQKYYLRRRNFNRRRRRSSLFDITTDSVAVVSTKEQVKVDNKDQVVAQPSGEMLTLNNGDQVNGGSRVVLRPFTLFPTPYPLDLNLNQKYEKDAYSVSLNLSLSFNPNRPSSYQVMSGFKNGDSMISVT